MKYHRLIPAVGAALILAACSGSDNDVGDDAVAQDDPAGANAAELVTLRMASPYRDPSWNYTPAVGHFVDAVEASSGGSITIEVQFAYGELESDAEQQVVSAVAAGEVDLAFVGTRVFDTLGVTSFQALHAPLLVDSYELQEAILASDLPEQMLAGLDDLDVTGLAILAGGLRKPIAVDRPLLGPPDYAGATIHAFRSEAQADTVTALGGTPTDVGPGQRDAGLVDGDIQGLEMTLNSYMARDMWSYVPYVTANVNLWAETTVLLVNPDTLASLSDAQAEWLHDAATDAAERSVGMHDVDAERTAEACEMGARFAEVSEAELAALREAVEPVHRELEADTLTADLIAQITELKQSVRSEPLAVPDGCTGEAPSVVASAADPDALPPGTYTSGEVTVEQRVAAGVAAGHDADKVEAEVRVDISEYSVFILNIMDNGRWSESCSDDGSPVAHCFIGTYEVDGDLILLSEGGCTRTMRFTIDGDQLHLEYLGVECTNPADAEDHLLFEPTIYSAVPFTRVD
jgi:TRAP-type transport system periplasmic protein